MKGCKTIAEFAIKKWMESNGFIVNDFSVNMNGNEAEIFDKNGDSMKVIYDKNERRVMMLDD